MLPSLRGSDGSSNSKPEGVDKLENYDILGEIGRGPNSIVRLAACKKGRLRNRKVALKEVHNPTNRTLTTASIHQALHHPSVVSCFSTFSTPSATYHVLEYCAHGNLLQFLRRRESPVLIEASEMRMVLKNLVDALICLRKNCIIHRDITAENVFVTEDYRVKLAGFGRSIRLPSESSTTNEPFGGTLSRASPEIVSQLNYSFHTDLWSLGCFILTCLSGTPPFKADSLRMTLVEVKSASYDIPDGIPSELKDLISGLLQIVPEHRTPLHQILSHPFFHPSLPICSLGPGGALDRQKYSLNSKKSENKPIGDESRYLRPQQGPKRHPLVDAVGRSSSKKVLGDVGNLRRLLRTEVQHNSLQRSDINQPPPRRVVSDPVTGTNARKKFLDKETVKVRFRSRSVVATPSFLMGLIKRDVLQNSGDLSDEEQLSTQSELPEESEQVRQSPPRCPTSSTPKQMQNLLPATPVCEETDQMSFESSDCNIFPPPSPPLFEQKRPQAQVAIGVTRPVKMNTSHLEPQTQKLNRGQLTILPSRSLLVDFREGERRQGRTGSEVLLVDPDGSIVKVYSAPHLSSPCCLAEPIALYLLEELPSMYWKQYNDAHVILEQMKQHVPKLVLFDTDVKCTLMANEPDADIELLFHTLEPDQASTRNPMAKCGSQAPHMRIRLSRKRQLVEISRQITKPSTKRPPSRGKGCVEGGEWRKKVIVAAGSDFNAIDQSSLEAEEVNGLGRAVDFISVCKAVETQTGASRGTGISHRYGQTPQQIKNSPPSNPSAVTFNSHAPKDTQRTVSNRIPLDISHLEVPPRRPRFSSKEPAGINQDSASWSLIHGGFDTRFIPSVGWCVRYGSSGGGAGRYKMMFFDGAVLEVDVDGECVELVNSVTEEVVRYPIRDCSAKRNVMDKMKSFKEFVSLFDDSSESI